MTTPNPSSNPLREPFFEFRVEDTFWITGHGAIITGTVIKGAVRTGDVVTLKKASGESKKVKILGIEGFRKILKEALAGENVGLKIAELDKSDFSVGDVLTFAS
jgi:elongation factor Tu